MLTVSIVVPMVSGKEVMPERGMGVGFWGAGNVLLFLDLNADYMEGLLCKNSLSYAL